MMLSWIWRSPPLRHCAVGNATGSGPSHSTFCTRLGQRRARGRQRRRVGAEAAGQLLELLDVGTQAGHGHPLVFTSGLWSDGTHLVIDGDRGSGPRRSSVNPTWPVLSVNSTWPARRSTRRGRLVRSTRRGRARVGSTRPRGSRRRPRAAAATIVRRVDGPAGADGGHHVGEVLGHGNVDHQPAGDERRVLRAGVAQQPAPGRRRVALGVLRLLQDRDPRAGPRRP